MPVSWLERLSKFRRLLVSRPHARAPAEAASGAASGAVAGASPRVSGRSLRIVTSSACLVGMARGLWRVLLPLGAADDAVGGGGGGLSFAAAAVRLVLLRASAGAGVMLVNLEPRF